MGIKFYSLVIKGIDVSQFNGTIDWSKVNCDFASVRVGYGTTQDDKFKFNWEESKGKVKRFPYWYLDYYSNFYNTKSPNYKKYTNAEWGIKQADLCWSLIKDDFEGTVYLDVEGDKTSYRPSISDPLYKDDIQEIMGAFLSRMDELQGKVTGIYASLGLLPWFYSKYRTRPLWCAWYNEYQTVETVKKNVLSKGWKGTVTIWQYASDGDVDDDGVGDGKTLGTQYATLDLNGWIGSQEQYNSMFSDSAGSVPDDESVTVVSPTYEVYSVKALLGLNVREEPKLSGKKVTKFSYGTKVNVYEIVTGDGTQKNGWARINGGYCSADYLKQ